MHQAREALGSQYKALAALKDLSRMLREVGAETSNYESAMTASLEGRRGISPSLCWRAVGKSQGRVRKMPRRRKPSGPPQSLWLTFLAMPEATHRSHPPSLLFSTLCSGMLTSLPPHLCC